MTGMARGFAPILAIETSQRTGGVALRDQRGEVHIEMLHARSRHDDDLMPAIDRLVRRAGLTPADLRACAVSIGPGGFTGLRIAVSTAKMLGEVLGVEIAAVPGALVVAERVEIEGVAYPQRIAIMLASKRDTAWETRLERTSPDEPWRVVGTPGLVASDRFRPRELAAVIGDSYLPESIRAACIKEGTPVDEPLFDPAACLGVGERMLAAGQRTDPLELLPLYSREPEAVSLWNRRRE